MSENSRRHWLMPVVLAALILTAGCATVAGTTTPAVEGTTPNNTAAGIERREPQSADQRVWIENACPREIMGPDPWKRCVERNLRALQAGLPDLTALANADRAWIENACPREVMGPDPWKRCAERNLRALQTGLPDLTAHASGASQDPASASSVDHNDGGWSNVATREKPRRILEEITEPEPTDHTTANSAPDPPRLAAPVDGERWGCYTNVLFSLSDRSPEIVLTREGKTDQPIGKGRVLVADVIYDAIFQIEGIDRRWDWSDGMDSIIVNPGGSAYFNFRLLEPGKTRLPPTRILWCNQK